MKKRTLAAVALLGIVMATGAMMFVPAAFAQEESGEEVAATGGVTTGEGLRVLGLGIGAGLAVGIAGFGTGTAQAGVGAGGTGAIAEKPELLINVLILFAIPETIVIFGMVIAFILMGNI